MYSDNADTNTDNIIIRSLRPEDIEELSRIESKSFSMPWSAADFAALLDRDYCVYLVAETEGHVAGSAGMTDICHEGCIDNVVVAEEFRGLGIAQKLMNELIKVGKSRGIEAFTLEVRVSNAPAVHIYEKLGFVSEGIRPNFYEKPREDAYIMWKRQ
jgi:ribosomal-protein-alanine N-acetyltransferase